MKPRCSQCDQPGYRFRGDRWLCVIHNRFDTMRNTARAKGKYVPTTAELATLAAKLVASGLKCEACQVTMQWAGKRGELTTVSLQHDRSGKIRLICVLCNSQHDDMPGDTFYDLPAGHKFCPGCKAVKPLAEFPKWGRRGRRQWPPRCRVCQKESSRLQWARYAKKRRARHESVPDAPAE